MVGYYLYGRDTINKYHSYVNSYSEADERGCFLRLANYHAPEGISLAQKPEKIYYFNFSASVGRAAVIGKTTGNTSAESPMADEGGRDTVFEQLYLFDGEDRKNLMKDSDRLFNLRPFCTRVEDILEEKTSNISQKKTYVYRFNDQEQDVFEQHPQKWSLEELLDYFGLDDKHLEELLYTFLHCDDLVYIMLPENTCEATERSLALMRRLLQIMPSYLVETAGFLTYAHAFADYEIQDRYIPLGVRYVFLANTEENRSRGKHCREEQGAYLFCPGYVSGVKVPPELYHVVEAMKKKLLAEEKNDTADIYWSLLNANGIPEAAQKVSEEEKIWMYTFAQNFLTLVCRREGRLATSEETLIQSMNGLMKQTGHWSENLTELNMAKLIQAYLESGAVTQSFYPALYEFYEKIESVKKDIEAYFAAQITDLQSLQYYEQLLPAQTALKESVWDLLYLKDSCHQAILEVEFSALRLKAEGDECSAEMRTSFVWDEVEKLSKKNCRLVQRPETVEYVRSYLERYLYHCALAEVKETLERSLERITDLQQGPYGYREMLAQLSEKYIAGIVPNMSKLKDSESRLLQDWPFELESSSEFSQAMEKDKVFREFRSKLLTFDAKAICKYLEGLGAEETELLKLCDKFPSELGNVLKVSDRLSEQKGKKSEKEKLFDTVHAALILRFPSYTEQILRHAMSASMGGVVSLRSIYSYMETYADREREDFEDAHDMRTLAEDMRDAVFDFYQEYQMGSADRKMIKQERKFLEERLGLDWKELLEAFK